MRHGCRDGLKVRWKIIDEVTLAHDNLMEKCTNFANKIISEDDLKIVIECLESATEAWKIPKCENDIFSTEGVKTVYAAIGKIICTFYKKGRD